MIKLKALNAEVSSEEDTPVIRREAQEEIVLDLYNKALRLQNSNQYDEAEDILHKLLKENIPQLEGQGGLPKTMSTIKFSCYMNLGGISLSKGTTKKALDNFLIASELDETDITLWYKIGMLSMKLNKFYQAAYAFSKGLECNESNWPCLDKLITVLFAVKDTIACLDFIDKALTLDPYYIKGIIFRKHIYRDNPATEEYYKLNRPNYNPQTKIDIEYSEVEEQTILNEVEVICDKIKEVDQSLIPKPLMTIPLPIPLEDFTWLALGKTITGIHQYLTDNNMTHLTKINLNKCMSAGMTQVEDKRLNTEEVEMIEKTSSPKPSEQIVEMEVTEAVTEETKEKKEENVDNNEMFERRMSTTSETDQNDNGTPSQTDDNDDMEQENEEQEENTAQKQTIGRPSLKCNKRKRDLVSELQIWGWHSKRKSTKKGKNEKDYTVEDALKRIIPSHLVPNGLVFKKYNAFEDSMSTMDLYNMHREETSFTDKMLSPLSSPNDNSKSYFGTSLENEDVKKFWSGNWENCDAIDLIEKYVYSISNLWSYKWPDELVAIYINAYNMFREHCSHPQVFSSQTKFEDLKNDALATLLFGELITYTSKKEILENKIHSASVSQLIFLSARDEQWGEISVSFSSRVHWLRTHLFKNQNETSLAIMALQVVQETLLDTGENSKNIKIHLPNCSKFNVISCSVIEYLLNELELIDSLSRLEELYKTEKYTEVSFILKSTFSSSTTNHMTCKRLGRPAQLALLMHSLWFTDTNDCFVWTEECFNESIRNFIRPGIDREKWELVVDKCLLFFMEIIKTETVSIVDVLTDLSQTRLIENLCSLCVRQINSNSSKIPLGNVLPWILLHYILLRDEHKQQAKKTIKHVKYDDLKGKYFNTSNEDDEEISPSNAILFSAHEFLGPKGWCLVNNGELLHFILDTIVYRLDTPIFESTRDKMEIHLEQAFFCLYQHPSKKNKVSRHLADHNIDPLPLTWERAHQLYEFFAPAYLPEFDSYKSVSISSELEQLLQRICAIVPKECDPQPIKSKVNDYINGITEEMPEPIEFPNKPRAIYYLLGDYYFKQSEIKKSYKYFVLDLCINPERVDSWAGLSLGIHSQLEYKLNHCERFKTEMEFIEKAKSSRICFKEALKLNDKHLTLWIEFGSFEYMVHSFCSRVLKYESDTLSMEKFEILETEKDRYLNSARGSFEEALALYRLDQGDPDERWLYHYMLAKIAEKKQEDPSVYLHHYTSAANLLRENKCTYPEKINYNNPQHLSLEALEVHYRINASILKYLELHEGKIIPCSLGKLFKRCLDNSMVQKSKYEDKPSSCESEDAKVKTVNTDNAQNENVDEEVRNCLENILKQIDDDASKSNPRNVQDIMDEMMKATMEKQTDICFDSDMESGSVQEVLDVAPKIEKMDSDEKASVKSEDESNIRKSTTTATEDSSSSSSSSNSSTSSDSESDDSSSTSDDSEENSNENLSDTEILSLVDRCIVGLEQCIRRLPQNYKALYRLAHLYFSYGKKKDLSKCKQLLLSEYKCRNGVLVSGLFSDRKTSNFFNGIWRIPSSEIDRPGSLSAHMGRCVTLLLQVLRDTHDHKILLELCLQLRRTPDADKVYIRNSEREQLSEQALTMCIQSIRTQIKNINNLPSTSVEKLLVDIFKAYQRSQKNLVHQEKVFSGLLVEAYKNWMGDKIPENANVFDLVTKYCQQCRIADKLKKQQQALLAPKSPIIAASPPVMPSPGNMVNPISLPIKRAGSGRPRGRPPGPKQLNQTRSPRGKSPVSGFHPQSWQNAFAAATSYTYMKQYQEELLRQYNQTLAMNQHLTTLGKNMFSSTGLLNAPTNSTSPLLTSSINSSPLITNTTTSKLNQNTTITTSSSTQKLLNTTPFKATNVSTTNSSILNSSTLMQQMNTLTANQITQSLSQLSPSLLNELSKQLTAQANNQILTENLRQLVAMGHQVMNKPTKQYNKVKSSKSVNLGNRIPEVTTGFKYPTEITKSKSSKTFKDLLKPVDPTVDFMKGRPNISITPVTQTTNTITNVSTGSSSPGKTLQEKLADKQKQQKSSAAKTLEFSAHSNAPVFNKSNYKSLVASMPTIPKALDVIPNYLLDSGLSISQVPTQPGVEILPISKKDPPGKSSILKSNVPKKDDKNIDDVIIIE